jgi:hypothetical protein
MKLLPISDWSIRINLHVGLFECACNRPIRERLTNTFKHFINLINEWINEFKSLVWYQIEIHLNQRLQSVNSYRR